MLLASKPRGSIYTTIRELGPKIPYYIKNYGSQFPNGCICGPSGKDIDRLLSSPASLELLQLSLGTFGVCIDCFWRKREAG